MPLRKWRFSENSNNTVIKCVLLSINYQKLVTIFFFSKGLMHVDAFKQSKICRHADLHYSSWSAPLTNRGQSIPCAPNRWPPHVLVNFAVYGRYVRVEQTDGKTNPPLHDAGTCDSERWSYLDDNPKGVLVEVRKEVKKERCGGVLENSLGRRNIPMELRCGILDHPSLKRKKPGCLDDRRMSLGIRRAASDGNIWQIESDKEGVDVNPHA